MGSVAVRGAYLIIGSAEAALLSLPADRDRPIKSVHRSAVSSVFQSSGSERSVVTVESSSHWEAHVGNQCGIWTQRCATSVSLRESGETETEQTSVEGRMVTMAYSNTAIGMRILKSRWKRCAVLLIDDQKSDGYGFEANQDPAP